MSKVLEKKVSQVTLENILNSKVNSTAVSTVQKSILK